MIISRTIKYKFNFFFYNHYGCNYKKYFLNHSKVTIHNVEAKISYAARFIEFTEENNKITGYMYVLLSETKSLFELESKIFLINFPEYIGHLILLAPHTKQNHNKKVPKLEL